MMRAGLESKDPSSAATLEGSNAKAMEAIASPAGYTTPAGAGKAECEPDLFAQSARARKPAIEAQEGKAGTQPAKAAYRDSAGRIWHYTGKRARVLALLVNGAAGVTQHDTLPWHTRLGATIHAMRCDGLNIATQIEGDCHHARYRLLTPGLLIDPNGGAA